MTQRYVPATSAPKLRALPFTGLRSAFADGYGARDLRSDVLAGLVVGVVALPLSMALAIAVGVPPQHGLYTAIVAGLIVPILGGSRFQVTGPTAAFVVILAPIVSRFHSVIDGVRVDGIPRLPPLPLKPWALPPELSISLRTLRALFPAALAIALLGAIESLLSAVVADGMAGTKHDPDAELLALGIGNVACPFFGGIAATGAIARTATGIRYGSRSPIATVVHSLVVLAAVMALAPVISYLPMASLGALLLLVAWHLSEAQHVFQIVRVAPKSDVAVLLTCYLLTVVFDMVVAVTAGMVLAAFLFMRRMAEVASVQLVENGSPHLTVKLPRDTVLCEVNGPLFFGAAETAMDAFKAIGARMRVLILNLSAVPAMDITGLVALESALLRLRQQGVLTLITGVRPQPEGVLKKAGVQDEPGHVQFCATLEEAAHTAAAHLGRPLPAVGT